MYLKSGKHGHSFARWILLPPEKQGLSWYSPQLETFPPSCDLLSSVSSFGYRLLVSIRTIVAVVPFSHLHITQCLALQKVGHASLHPFLVASPVHLCGVDFDVIGKFHEVVLMGILANEMDSWQCIIGRHTPWIRITLGTWGILWRCCLFASCVANNTE